MKTASIGSVLPAAKWRRAARFAITRPSPLALLCASLLLLYVALIAGYLAETDGLFDNDGYLVGRDFVVWWLAAKAALVGHLADVFDRGLFRASQVAAFGEGFPEHVWMYPPHYVLPLLPLGLLPYLWSFLAWTAVTFAAYAWSVVAGIERRWPTVLLLLTAPATYVNTVYGQNGFLTAALLLAGLRLLPTHPVLSGIAFGFLTVKPHLGLLIPVALLVTGSWRTIASASVTAAVLAGSSVVVFGTRPWLSYLAATTEMQSTALLLVNEMMVTPFAAARLLGFSAGLCAAVTAVSMALAIGCVAWAYRQPARPELQHAVLIAATFLAAPYALTYDLTALSAAVVLVWLGLPAAERTLDVKVVLMAAWLLPFVGNLANVLGAPIGPIVLTAFLALVLVLVRRGRVVPAVSPRHR